MNKLIDSMKFAVEAHKNQKRKDKSKTAYIVHPIEVLDILQRVGVVDEDILSAAVLHDVIEDTQYDYYDLWSMFGNTVANYVDEVSDDKTLPKQKRKNLQIETMSAKSDGAKLIKIADKISNMKSILTTTPVSWSVERKEQYFDWAKKVVDQGRGINTKLDEMFDEIDNLRDML